ncbi:MAG: hypothetical protein R2843_14560 [Thermomicrobiales bacterium]
MASSSRSTSGRVPFVSTSIDHRPGLFTNGIVVSPTCEGDATSQMYAVQDVIRHVIAEFGFEVE